MTTPWYYEFHEQDTFPYQQQLCDAVRWSDYNLEGQILKSPYVLSPILGNPITIRLLALNEALEKFNYIEEIDNEIKGIVEEQFKKYKSFGMKGNWFSENNILNTDGAPIETIQIEEKQFKIRHIDIQLALYEFFTNFGSILDRLAYEIDRLYELNIPRRSLDWTYLTSENNIKKVIIKNNDLSNLLEKYRGNFYNAIRYRNRLTHDGIIIFKSEINHNGISIKLNEDPDNSNSIFNVNAIKYCIELKIELLNLLNESYKIMLQQLNDQGIPPL